MAMDHVQRGAPLGVAVGLGQVALNNQPGAGSPSGHAL
jgi:hypothetical protein